MKRRIVVGLMSGTSMDGIDAAVLEIRGAGARSRARQLAFIAVPYPRGVRDRLFRICAAMVSSPIKPAEISSLNFQLGDLFAQAAIRAARRAGLALDEVDLIGSHGQTIYHDPQGSPPSTLQLGEPAIIAERTGVTTVADFRPADIAAGGEGAPLVPYVHYLLFRDKKKSRAIHNLGGISNLTYLPAGARLRDVVAFDTGPGNMVIDGLCRWLTRGKKGSDRGGAMARRGTVQEGLLRDLLRHPFFAKRPPKSTGREEFGAAFVSSLIHKARRRGMRPLDLLTTATALTARSIGRAYRDFILRRLGKVDEIYFTGGGRKNHTLLELLRRELPCARVGVVEELGWDGDALEAQAFALLAHEAVEGSAGNLPRATGARHEVILGKIVPGRNYRGVRLRRSKFKVQGSRFGVRR